MAALAGSQVRHHKLEIVASSKKQQATSGPELVTAGGDQFRQLGTTHHAVSDDQRRSPRVVVPRFEPEVERHRHGGRL